MKILLHIGAGKCGSSALQRFLSLNPILPLRAGGRLIYAAIQKDGSILTGAQLKRRAVTSISNYANSAPFGYITRQPMKFEIPEAGKKDVVVLSSEGWRKEFDRLKIQDALAPFGEVEALMYVRPQTEYINSAYWQWGAWSDLSFDDWFASILDDAKWYRSAQAWKKSPRVKKLTVRIVPKDVVTDFLEFIGAAPSVLEAHDGKRLNSSLSDSILRVLQRHRELRPSSHQPDIDFVLEKHFGHLPGKPAWVLKPEHIETIVSGCKTDNKKLKGLLSDDQAEAMTNDPKWWEVVVPDRNLADPGVIDPIDPDADALLATAFSDLLKAERERLLLKTNTPFPDKR